MIKSKIIRLKKYLFLISIIFLVISLSHLIYIFIYNDSKLYPIKGGTVSEGLIGNFPSLNPLQPLKGNNKYMVNLLYRGLLKYDSKEEKIVSDLASCDISNLLYVECYLEDNIFWSNGDKITTKDIISTYNILKNTGVNKVYSSLLEGVEIKSEKENIVIFKNTNEEAEKDINFLNIFFQPIVSEKTTNSISEDNIFGNFPTHEQIYSGDFMISNISSDMTIGITKIVLSRNTFNSKGNIERLIIKLFPNINSLLQNKESINIFNDNDNIISNSIPRLEANKYTLPQYVSLYINQENIDNLSLRNYIFNKVNTDNLIKILGEDDFEKVNNPYLSQTSIEKELVNKNFEKIIEGLGYIKKSKIIENFLPNSNATYSDEAKITEKTQSGTIENTQSGATIEEEIKLDIADEDLTIDKFQEDSKYITDPEFVDKYNFVTKDNILLQGNAGKNIEDIYINDYKLSNYTKGNPKFYYRIKESYNNIEQGVNSYKIYFVENGKKELKEEIIFIYNKNKTKLNAITKDFIKELYTEEEKRKKDEEKKIESEKENNNIVKENEIKLDKDELEKISNLDEKFYYNDKYEKFSINLFYISSERHLEESAYFIQNSLLEIGVNVELFPVSISDLRLLLSEKNKYDMLLTGINLGYFDYNIFPYFHSGQVKNGYNFSNIKKTSLDLELEELKSDIRNNEEKEKIKQKILSILKNEQVVKTLYTPKSTILIDKNIKNISIPEKLINKSDIKDIYNSLYINEEKIINFENKGVINFFNFILKKLNE